jgi:hypothetical protein
LRIRGLLERSSEPSRILARRSRSDNLTRSMH